MMDRSRVIQELPDNFAPYAAIRNVMDIITRKRERGLPTPINSQALETISIPAGNVSRTLQALRFLNLIDDYGSATELFERLSRAGDADGQYKELLGEIIKDAYQRVFAIVDPAQDGEVAISDAFRQFEPQAQRSRMVTFFLGMCGQAGITETKRRSSRGTAKPRQKSGKKERHMTQSTQSRVTTGEASVESQVPVVRVTQGEEGDYRLIFAVMQQLPPQRQWSAARRQKWLRAVEATVDLVIDVVSQEYSDSNEEETQ